MPFSVGKGCVFCCFLLVCGAFISAADTFITAIDLRKLRRFGAFFSTFLFACFHSGDKPPRWRENFACTSGCSGGKVRCSCAVRCQDPGINSTPVLLSWIVLVWLSPLAFLGTALPILLLPVVLHRCIHALPCALHGVMAVVPFSVTAIQL